MLNKNFYIEFGRVVYAMAMADGEIHPEERKVLYDMVREELAPIENATDEFGSDLAFYTLFSFEEESDAVHDTVEAAIGEFADYLHTHKIKLTEKAKTACTNILKKMAASYGRTTKAEKAVLEKFIAEMDGYVKA